ncbi:MAG: ankyrin repeat domain-containing protein [Synergistaceae bacterium]|jgi:hypothetical protein|nr:ankyrin repeat domain-containing protein [Synergistaceae bacterium]
MSILRRLFLAAICVAFLGTAWGLSAPALAASKTKTKTASIVSKAEAFLKLCVTGTSEDVRAAIAAGADVNAKDKDGVTALIYAAEGNNPEVLTVLIEAGADVNAKAKNGATALACAALFNSNPEVISVLVKAGADVNAKDDEGWTVLLHAAESKVNAKGKTEVLLEAGANVLSKTNDGSTILDIAKYNKTLKGTPFIGELTKIYEAALAKAPKTFTVDQILDRLKQNTPRFRNDFKKAGNINIVGVVESINEIGGHITLVLKRSSGVSSENVSITVPEPYRDWSIGLDAGEEVKVTVFFTDTILMGAPVFKMADQQVE